MNDDPVTRDLVVQAQAGSREAFDTLLTRFRPRLGTVVYFRLGALAGRDLEVEDVLQEASVRALASIERFEWRGEESFFGWLRQIAEHVILEAAGRRKRRPTLTLEEDAAAAGTSPSRVLRREERFERLQAALDGLSPDHRRVILLARIEGLPIQEIAGRMGRSADAVSNLLARALSRLKESFGDTESLALPDRLLDEPEEGRQT